MVQPQPSADVAESTLPICKQPSLLSNQTGSVFQCSLSSVDSSHCPSNFLQCEDVSNLLEKIQQGQLMMVDRRRRNGLILYKKYHAEFAGPGAAIGGQVDRDCQGVLPVGNLLLLELASHEERQESYKIRRQWIRLTHQFTENKLPTKRAQMILKQFETYFDEDTIARIPDEVFAMLVGVLPYSVANARRSRRKRNK